MGYMLEWELQCHVASELIQSFTCALFDGCKATVNNNTFLNFSSHFFEVQLTILHSTYFFYRGMAFLESLTLPLPSVLFGIKITTFDITIKSFQLHFHIEHYWYYFTLFTFFPTVWTSWMRCGLLSLIFQHQTDYAWRLTPLLR